MTKHTMFDLPPILCSQGGFPYNKPHLDAKDAEIRRLQAENERLRNLLHDAHEWLMPYEGNCPKLMDRMERALATGDSDGS